MIDVRKTKEIKMVAWTKSRQRGKVPGGILKAAIVVGKKVYMKVEKKLT